MPRLQTRVLMADASRPRLCRVDVAEGRLEVVHEDETVRTRARAGDIQIDRDGSRMGLCG